MKSSPVAGSLLLALLFIQTTQAQVTVTFRAKDGITVTADLYHVADSLPVILLCHQAQFSRGEFEQTAPKLNEYGFNCLAVDLRYGDEVNGVKDKTAMDAARLKKPQTNADAELDIIAGVNYLYEKYRKKILLLGSSYSASLALKVANENDRVFAAVAFSPGEYFSQKNFVASHIEGMTKPVFITSSKKEADEVTDLVKDIQSRIKVQYIPMSVGEHGAKVLWSIQPFSDEYWLALKSFLDRMKKTETQ